MRHPQKHKKPRPQSSWQQPGDRTGAFMLELVVGTVILGIFLSSMGSMFHWIQQAKRTNDRHLAATQELSTQMEKLAAMPPAQLTEEMLLSLRVSESTQTLLPDATLTAESEPDSEQMQRLTLTLSWINDAGLTVEPKRLTAWFPLISTEETE